MGALNSPLFLVNTLCCYDLFVYISADNSGTYFIDGTDEAEEGVWVSTTTGEVLSYLNWRPGEPNNVGEEDCIIFALQDGTWLDASCPNRLSRPLCQCESK